MGIFNNLFNSTKEENNEFPWYALESVAQLDTVVEESTTQTVAIFKHSTRCMISKMVKSSFENNENAEANVKLYYLDLIAYREVSNAIESRFGITHESPQLLIIENGDVIQHASHGDINTVTL